MHIHFWWVCIVTSVPPVLGVDCNWGSQQPEQVQQHWKIAPGLLTGVHVKESRMSMFDKRNQGCWQHGGKPGDLVPAPACDLQQGRLTLAFGLCGVARARSSLLLLFCGAPICPVLSQWARAAGFWRCPAVAPCLPAARYAWYLWRLQWHLRLFLITRRGHLLLFYLFKIWSCLVVRTELLGSAGSPKCRTPLFGPRLLLCEYML